MYPSNPASNRGSSVADIDKGKNYLLSCAGITRSGLPTTQSSTSMSSLNILAVIYLLRDAVVYCLNFKLRRVYLFCIVGIVPEFTY